MIEFGKTLRSAREAKGFTISDVAEKTHMMSSMIADLEDENFSRLAAPIYGRGFIKLYCGAVGLDPQPMIEEFMEIFNGNREPAIRERVIEPPVQEPAAVEIPPPMTAKEPPANDQPDLFSAPQGFEPASPAIEQNDRVFPAEETPVEESKERHLFSQYAAPLRERVSHMSYAPAAGRWCVIAAALALVLFGAIAGIRALYRATSTDAVQIATADESVSPRSSAFANDLKTTRQPIAIPDLYID